MLIMLLHKELRMDYCILNDETIIENMIVCEDDTTAELFGAVPAYEGARIGDVYDPTGIKSLEIRMNDVEDAIVKGLSL